MPPVVKTSVSAPEETIAQWEALADFLNISLAAAFRLAIDEAAHRHMGKAAPPGPGKVRAGRPKKNVAKG